ncbi:hypothetical protein SAMN05880573_102242 [Chryseobacterium sp. RU33C]|nr:hypothetical protein SAMN05880573_102242 [Chryseobacterium sp. RU33C]
MKTYKVYFKKLKIIITGTDCLLFKQIQNFHNILIYKV